MDSAPLSSAPLSLSALASFVPEPGVAQYAVLGHPIVHSLSPQMQEAAFAAARIPARYRAIDCPAVDLPAVVQQLKRLGFAGWNCTLPLKTEMVSLVDTLAPSATAVGAVNTVVCEEGRLIGHSTDGLGWERAIFEVFGRKIQALRILILGAGGSGRTLALYAAQAGCPRLTITNRTAARAEEVAAVIRAKKSATPVAAIPWKSAALARAVAESDLVVNTTSLGLDPKAAALPLPHFRPGLYAYDLVYRATPFLAAAEAGGAVTANGLSMLLHQGALAWEVWNRGKIAPLEAMRQALASTKAAFAAKS